MCLSVPDFGATDHLYLALLTSPHFGWLLPLGLTTSSEFRPDVWRIDFLLPGWPEKSPSVSFPNTEVPQISKVDCLMHLNPFLNVFYVISWLSDLWTSSCLQVWYTPSASLWTSPVALLMTSLSVRAPPLCCCCWWWQWCTSAAPLWKHLS